MCIEQIYICLKFQFSNKKNIHEMVWKILTNVNKYGGSRGVVVIAVGNEHGDTSSNPGRDWLHFTLH